MNTPKFPPVHSRDARGTALYEKSCNSCGKISIVDRRRLNCLCTACAGAKRKTHGLTSGAKHPLYKVLNGMIVRCTYPSATHYKYYGGRGIDVCQTWREDPQSFVSWAESQGWIKGLEVDRINPDGNYSPENCRIITHRENSQKTRRIKTKPEQVTEVRKALASGMSLNHAAQSAGVSYMVAWHIKNTPGVWCNVL